MRGDQRIGVLRSGRGNLWHIGIASMSTRAGRAANPKVSGRAARTQIVSQHSHPRSANTPLKIEKKYQNVNHVFGALAHPSQGVEDLITESMDLTDNELTCHKVATF